MRTVSALLVSLVFAACTAASHEDAAYDLVKAQAAKDLGCGDVTVKKMAQADDAYEYQASGCSDLFSYGVDCDGSCRIVAGVRGPGLGAMWNKAGSLFDFAASELVNGAAKVHEDMQKSEARFEEMRARNEQFRREVDERMAETRRLQAGAR